MKLKKFLAIGCAAVMALSLAACAGGESSKKSPASLNFEDGKFGFALVSTDSAGNDASVLSVESLNGSKVLYAKNQGKQVMKIGIDLTATLGDDVANLASIEFEVGSKYEGSFAACNGKVFGYFGETKDQSLADFTIYMEKKNPVTVKVEVKDLKAGERNYITVVKTVDKGAKPGDMFIDNIAFKDASGKLLKAKTDGTFDAPEGYVIDWSQVKGDIISVDTSYPGEWALCTNPIPASAFEKYAETGVTVKVEATADMSVDNLCIKPVAPDYKDIYSLKDADGNPVGAYSNLLPTDCAADGAEHGWHLKGDGVFHNNTGEKSFTFTIAGDTVKELIARGGMNFQVNGYTVNTVTLTEPEEELNVDRSKWLEASGPAWISKGELTYVGDWSYTTVAVTPGELADGENTVTVTLVKMTGDDYTYWLAKPMTADWGPLTVGYEGGFNDDGYVVVSESGEFTFTLDAEATAACKAGHGFGFQVYGVAVEKAAVNGNTVYDVTTDDWSSVIQIAAASDLLDDGCKVTFTAAPVADDDHTYWLAKMMDTNWTVFDFTLVNELEINGDGYIVLTAGLKDPITITLSAEQVKAIKDGGAAGIGMQFFGVVPSQAKIDPLD